MKRETQSKAIAAAVSGLLVAVIPMLTSIFGGADIAPDQIASAGEAFNALLVAAGGALVAWLTVWLAPRNKPIED